MANHRSGWPDWAVLSYADKQRTAQGLADENIAMLCLDIAICICCGGTRKCFVGICYLLSGEDKSRT
ncbi:MAG: hypothetical protein Q7U57_03900 [Methylovulum sp.]|nr:hypothetical protein [Methylovulum sp.]